MSRSNMPITPALKKSRKENEREVESHQDNQFSSSLFSDPESMFNSIMSGLETSPDDGVSANTHVYHTINSPINQLTNPFGFPDPFSSLHSTSGSSAPSMSSPDNSFVSPTSQSTQSVLFSNHHINRAPPALSGLLSSPENDQLNHSVGLSNPLLNSNSHHTSAPLEQTSYSSIAKKEPLQPIQPTHNVPRLIPTRKVPKSAKRKEGLTTKVTQTAVEAGYNFVPAHPSADPRYPSDQQLMVGPITMGSRTEDHDVFYQGFRSFLNRYGAVAFMYIHQRFVQEPGSGQWVKYGYVVFAESGVAQNVERRGSVTYQGQRINVQGMM